MKIVPEPSTTRNAMFNVIRSNTEIAITPPRIVRLHSNGTELHHVTDDTLLMFKVKGPRSRSRRKVMYQQQKRYNTAMDRFGDFKLGRASQLKQEGTGVAQTTSSCNALAIATFSGF